MNNNQFFGLLEPFLKGCRNNKQFFFDSFNCKVGGTENFVLVDLELSLLKKVVVIINLFFSADLH